MMFDEVDPWDFATSIFCVEKHMEPQASPIDVEAKRPERTTDATNQTHFEKRPTDEIGSLSSHFQRETSLPSLVLLRQKTSGRSRCFKCRIKQR
jgi:hypothetical protein